MRPVTRGDVPKDANGVAIKFATYGKARDYLIGRIGDYCSYCEIALHSGIQVEHVQPKKWHEGLKTTWTNFLFACESCNKVKGQQDVILDEYYWPDKDNTARPFLYVLDRSPQVNTGLSADQQVAAIRTLKLTGIDREPGDQLLREADVRWRKRREAWGVALRERQKLQQSDTVYQRDSAVQVAIARGFWSVWMQVFHDDIDMRNRLNAAFQGTAEDCFDNTTQPCLRPGGQL
jgi:hypothetical protein